MSEDQARVMLGLLVGAELEVRSVEDTDGAPLLVVADHECEVCVEPSTGDAADLVAIADALDRSVPTILAHALKLRALARGGS